LTLWRSLAGCTKIQGYPFNRTCGFLGLSLLQCAEICGVPLSGTAQSVVQLYHHILLSCCLYQVTVKMHRACCRKVVLHQRVLMNSSFLSNKLIQSISHSCQSVDLPCCWDTRMPASTSSSPAVVPGCRLAGCSSSTSSRNFADCSYRHLACLSSQCTAPTSLMPHITLPLTPQAYG